MPPKVSLIKCPDYSESTVENSVRESLHLIGGINRIIKPGSRVLLKVNLLAPASPDQAVTTHPAVVKAVIKCVKEAGGSPFVADSPGFLFAGGKNHAMIESGIMEAAGSLGVEALQFESIANPFVKTEIKHGVWLDSFYAARLALEADVIISLPKLKTHGNTLYTGAVKNMFGAAAPATRRKAHSLAAYDKFSGAIVDIYSALRPSLAVMDAVVGMEGLGPRHGHPKHVGLILASYDPVALDAAASKVIGFDPMEIFTTKLAEERGLGCGDLGKIEITGEKLDDVAVNFMKPSKRILNVPGFLIRFLSGLAKVEPAVVPQKCSSCGICVKSCPVDAMTLRQHPVIDRTACIKCFCCNELCPEHAIEIKRSWMASRLMKV